jgi:hypothetical protein
MIREPIYSALFNLLRASAQFQTTSRRFQHWTNVSAPDQPALYMMPRTEGAETVPGLNTIWTLQVDVMIYVNTGGNDEISPNEVLNPLLDAVVASIAPSTITNKQTLGGLCEHCWIEGQIQTDEGVLSDQGFALIPIFIKVSS